MRASNIGGDASGLGLPDNEPDFARRQRPTVTHQQNVAGLLDGLSQVHRPASVFSRNTREALLSDLGPHMTLVTPPGNNRTFVVRFEGQVVRLHVGDIKTSMEMTYEEWEAKPELFESERADDIPEVLIGWADSLRVYCLRSPVQTGFDHVDDRLLDDARRWGIASRPML